MIDAGDSLVILEWSKNHPDNLYLKIAILWAAVTSAAKRFKDPAKKYVEMQIKELPMI